MNTINPAEEVGFLMLATAVALNTFSRDVEKKYVAQSSLRTFPFEYMVWLKRRMIPLLFIGAISILLTRNGEDRTIFNMGLAAFALRVLAIGWVGSGISAFIAWPVQRWLFTEARGKPVSKAKGLKLFFLCSIGLGLLLWAGSLIA